MRYSCTDCKKRNKCNQICKKMEKYLQRKQFRKRTVKKGYAKRHIRRKEIPYPPEQIETIAANIIKNYI